MGPKVDNIYIVRVGPLHLWWIVTGFIVVDQWLMVAEFEMADCG